MISLYQFFSCGINGLAFFIGIGGIILVIFMTCFRYIYDAFYPEKFDEENLKEKLMKN
jgi:hypothetical protein